MRKRLVIFIVLIFLSFGSYTQNVRLDSLLRVVKTETDPVKKVKTLGLITFEYLYIDPKKSLEYNKETVRLALATNDSFSIASAYLYTGLYYEAISEYQKSLYYSFKALKIADKGKNVLLIENLYNNIAIVYLDLENYPLALEYLNKGLEMSKKHKSNKSNELSATYTNIGIVHMEMNEFEQARSAFNRSLALDLKARDSVPIILDYNNLASLYVKEKKYDEGLKYCQTGYPLALKLNLKNLQVEFLKIRAEIHQASSEFTQGRQLLLQAEKIAKELRSLQLQTEIYKQLVDLEKAQGNYKSALAYYDKFHDLNDSLISKEKNKQILIIEAQYKSNYKEQENKVLKAQNEKKQIQLDIQFAFIVAGFMVFLLTVWICIVIYRSKKRQQKSNHLLLNQQLAIQDQNEQLNKLYEEIMLQNDSIQEQYKMLDQLNNVKNQLFSVISHDVRSPLNSIKGALELFEKGYLENEEIKEMAGRLKVKVQNTSSLLDNLLHWSRSQMEGIKVNSVKVDLQKIAEQNYQLILKVEFLRLLFDLSGGEKGKKGIQAALFFFQCIRKTKKLLAS